MAQLRADFEGSRKEEWDGSLIVGGLELFSTILLEMYFGEPEFISLLYYSSIYDILL